MRYTEPLDPMADSIAKPGLLNSWKEIATYLGRGVRTVQRWERLGLPVRRVGEGAHCPVVAMTGDIDRWVRESGTNGFHSQQSTECLMFRGALHESVEQARLLRSEMAALRFTGQQTLQRLIANIARLQSSCEEPQRNSRGTAAMRQVRHHAD
jgi:hypothetical protein